MDTATGENESWMFGSVQFAALQVASNEGHGGRELQAHAGLAT